MHSLKKALGAGVAALATVGFCGIALAQGPQENSAIHTMTVDLPDGGVAQIKYSGPVAPRVRISGAPTPIFAAMPPFLDASRAFAEMERISAAMDRRTDRMFREAAALVAGSAQPDLAAIATMPAGSSGYSFVSEMNGNDVCTRGMVITSQGNGAAPRVVTHTSGNCAAVGAPGFGVPTQLPSTAQPKDGPPMIMTKALGAHPREGLIHEAALN